MAAPKQTGADVVPLTSNLVAPGSEIRQLRRARQMTLKQVARDSGVSLSHLSAIERGNANPSLDVIEKIALALDVSPEWFFVRRAGNGPMERAYVVRRPNRRNLNTLYGETVEEAGYSDALLSASIGGNFCMGVADYAPRTANVPDQLFQHGGELHGYVLEGELELLIGDEQIRLRQGDSYSFPASVIHDIRNTSNALARLIWATGPVIIPKDVVARPGEDQSAPKRQPKTQA